MKTAAACILLLVCSRSILAATRVVPLDGLTLVDPLTGDAVRGVGENAGTSWQQRNPVWDGKTICLRAAKGETLLFQIVFLYDPSETVEGITIDGLEGARVYRSWHIWDTPEVAVPVGKGRPSFDLPGGPSDGKPRKATAWSAWVELSIPRSAEAGERRYDLRVAAARGLTPLTFPVALEILPFELPRRPSLIVEMNTYGDYTKHLGCTPQAYLGLQRLMREHRCTLVQVPYRQGGQVYEFLAPKVDSRTGALDWELFDQTLGGLFDGTAFDDGEPVTHFILPLCYDWPVPFKTYEQNREQYEARNTEARREIVRHIRAKRWTKTVFQEFHNENPSAGAKCPWHLDEPRAMRDLEGHELYTGLLRRALAGTDDIRLHYRLDVSAWQPIRAGLEKLASGIDDWCVSRDPRFLNAELAPMFRSYANARKGLLMEYGEVSGFMSGDKQVNLAVVDRYAKNCWELRLDGYEQWMIDLWREKAGTTPMTYSNAAGARDLIWPGKFIGLDGPLASLRLKAIRESLNLMDYAFLAAAKAGGEPAVDEVIRGLDGASAESHFRAKQRVSELVTQRP